MGKELRDIPTSPKTVAKENMSNINYHDATHSIHVF